jgi:hypothetical protein
MLNMVVMTQTVNWWLIMYSCMNSNGPDEVPTFEVAPFLSLFFIFFVIFGAFFIINLFVGVIINAFTEAEKQLGKDWLLTES